MNSLAQKIRNKESNITLYGMTPPKVGADPEAIVAGAERLKNRIGGYELDGLILYDVQDEETRTDVARPFPYMASIDPVDYKSEYISDVTTPSVVYKCVGKYSVDEMKVWLEKVASLNACSVFVGMASRDQKISMTLDEAYALKKQYAPDVCLGAVMIPERHAVLHDEPARMLNKVKNGVEYFVTQMVYDIPNALSCLQDYKAYFDDNKQEIVPVVFTISPCGSVRTMEFMKWLGISIPISVATELIDAEDMLQQSVEHCHLVIESLKKFCLEQGIPYGFNVESVAIRKVEVEAAVSLLEVVSVKNPC